MTRLQATLTIDSIAAGGDGVGRADGLAVFVPRTAPGDVARVTYQVRRRLGRGEVMALTTPSIARTTPACIHYDRDDCGGCQLQHLEYQAQLEAKRLIVQDAFRRIARRDVTVPAVTASPKQWTYRSRLTLAMRAVSGHWVMGLHSRKDVDRVFDLGTCPITDDRVVAAWRAVRSASGWLPEAGELRGTVRLAGGRLHLTLEGGTTWDSAASFAAACPGVDVIRWKPTPSVSRVIVDRTTTGHGGDSFGQVNAEVALLAREEILWRAMAVLPATAIDAYAGVGENSEALAGHGVRVTAIELDPAATTLAAERLRAPNRVRTGRVEDLLEAALPADVVILNPPRGGVDNRVTRILQDHRPQLLLYMSCDPATLARDIARLPAYRLVSVQAYDMFPQTAHVEVVCSLVPEGA